MDSEIRFFAINRLGELGPDAADAVPILMELMTSEKAESIKPRLFRTGGSLAETAMSALSEIGQPAVPALIAALRRGNTKVKWYARRTLSDMGEEAVPALVGLLDDEDPIVRYHGALALLSKRDLESFRCSALLEESWPRISRILEKVPPGSPFGDIVWRWNRLLTVLATAANKEALIKELVHALDDPAFLVRQTAAEALGRYAEPGSEAHAKLERAARDRDVYVRKAARAALERIERRRGAGSG